MRAAPVAVPVAEAMLLAAPVPVSVRFRVSLLFRPVGWNKYWGSLFSTLESIEAMLVPATIGPTIRAIAITSRTKYKIAYRQTRLLRSFDCFIE